MSRVYFTPLADASSAETVSRAAGKLFDRIVEAENIALEKEIPLKVHCGEAGNRTFIPPGCYDGVIDRLAERGITSCFIETSVLYGGKRGDRASHEKLAVSHGFTRLPFIIADGEHGEDSCDVPVNGKHFKHCHLGKKFADHPQLVVMSHFKGHALAGFGGSIKQLGMGFASKGGKMAMHLGVKPRIRAWKCRKCGMCVARCRAGAITLEPKPVIDREKCLGCGACYSACRNHAVSILTWGGLLYFVFALNITRGCDCEPVPMLRVLKDIGIFVSTDSVAADAAAFDAAVKRGKRFRGGEQLDYAEKIGLGTRKYELVEVVCDD